MTTGVPSVFRSKLLIAVEWYQTSQPAFQQNLEAIDQQSQESTPQAKNPAYQRELQKIHGVYVEILRHKIDSLRNLYALGPQLEALARLEVISAEQEQPVALDFLLAMLRYQAIEGNLEPLGQRMIELINIENPSLVQTNPRGYDAI
jgi:hypothetical protein